MALPGTYTLRLNADGKVQTSQVTVEPDSRVNVSQADLEGQFKLSLAIRDAISSLAETTNQIRSIRQQLDSLAGLLKDNPQAVKLIESSQALAKNLDVLEAKLHNPKAEISYDIMAQPGGAMLYSKLSALLSTVQSSDSKPTQGMTEMYGEYRRQLDALTKDFQTLVAGPVATINQMARDLKLPHILVREAPVKR
jgi:hypothetical protein